MCLPSWVLLAVTFDFVWNTGQVWMIRIKMEEHNSFGIEEPFTPQYFIVQNNAYEAETVTVFASPRFNIIAAAFWYTFHHGGTEGRSHAMNACSTLNWLTGQFAHATNSGRSCSASSAHRPRCWRQSLSFGAPAFVRNTISGPLSVRGTIGCICTNLKWPHFGVFPIHYHKKNRSSHATYE